MTRFILLVALAVFALGANVAFGGSPEQDRQDFVNYYTERFPDVPVDDFINGMYTQVDDEWRARWEEGEDFPNYLVDLDEGETLFHQEFANGNSLANCFAGYEDGIRQNYPYFDGERGEVITIEYAINLCREENGEEPLPYKKGKIAQISAYLANLSNGKTIAVSVPEDNPAAMEWYERGKSHFYSPRGQLDMACADCHYDYAGHRVRTQVLSPALGHPSHFPVYRKKWTGLGTMHRRFAGCNEQVRAKAFPAQSEEYRALEYFLNVMSNGLAVNAPATRP